MVGIFSPFKVRDCTYMRVKLVSLRACTFTSTSEFIPWKVFFEKKKEFQRVLICSRSIKYNEKAQYKYKTLRVRKLPNFQV